MPHQFMRSARVIYRRIFSFPLHLTHVLLGKRFDIIVTRLVFYSAHVRVVNNLL